MIDLIKALAWPITSLVMVFYFKSEIRALIPRVKKAGLGGVELNDKVEKQADKTKHVTD